MWAVRKISIANLIHFKILLQLPEPIKSRDMQLTGPVLKHKPISVVIGLEREIGCSEVKFIWQDPDLNRGLVVPNDQ